MGNYAHLFTSDSESPNYTLEEDDICLQAKYAIPVFWFLLFNSESYRYITPVHAYEPDPADGPDHFFTMTHEEALERYTRKEHMLFEIVPSEWKSLSSQFIEFLRSKPLKYVHMSVGDLAAMTDDGFEDRVKYALDSLDEPPLISPTGFLARYRRPRLRDGWDTLLGLANIRYGKIDRLNYWDLAGVGEAEKAPWDED